MNYRNYRNDPAAGGYQQPAQNPGPFPGLGGNLFGAPTPTVPLGAPQVPAPLPVQAVEPVITPAAELVEADSAAKAASGLSLPNLTELKGIVDRLGGIDGILSTMTKVQKVVGNVQQMAPLVKLLFKTFGKGGGAAAPVAHTAEESEWTPPRRPKKRRKPSGAGTVQKRRRPRRR